MVEPRTKAPYCGCCSWSSGSCEGPRRKEPRSLRQGLCSPDWIQTHTSTPQSSGGCNCCHASPRLTLMLCVCPCVLVYVHVCQGQKSRSRVLLSHSPPHVWRQPLGEQELSNLAGQKALGIQLTLSPRHWDYSAHCYT